MMSGARRTTSSRVTIRSFADLQLANSGKMSAPPRRLDQFRHPGDSGNHGFVPFLEIDLGTLAPLRRSPPRILEIDGKPVREILSAILRADQCAERPDHVQDFRDGPLIEGVDRDTPPERATPRYRPAGPRK
jgi:hypothetical protein